MSATTNGVTVRRLSAEEAREVEIARLVAVEYAPYLAHAVFAARPVAAEGLGTLAVDRAWRLYLDPALLVGPDAWPTAVLGGSLVHEAGHLLRDHADRARAVNAQRRPVLWNIACDAAINDDLIEASIPLPEGVVTPAGLGLAPGGIEEDYFADLQIDPPDLGDGDGDEDGDEDGDGDGQSGGDDGAGCGSGAGDPVAAWELPSGDDRVAAGVSDAVAAAVRQRVAEDIAATSREGGGRGSVPAGWQRWAEQELSPATVPWQRELRATVRRAVNWAAGRVDYTYKRPGRRQVRRVITPSMRRPVVNVAVVIDTSASMGHDQLVEAVSEVEGILRAVPGQLTVLACDAAATEPRAVRSVASIELTGGGGTDMRIGISAAEQATPAPDVIVVLTDGETPWPATETRARLIAAVTGGHSIDRVPSWARAISVGVNPGATAGVAG